MSRATTLPRRGGSNTALDRPEWPRGHGSDSNLDVRQELLPPLRWLLQPDSDRFAHPAEVELARLLTFYGLRWAYEPTTFAVRWGSDGRPQEFVTPDFYLPDHDLYLELTTMRQRLVTRKNRKFRLLRQAYPNVRVRLLYLRDFERLQNVYQSLGPDQEARIGEILYDAQDVERRVGELAQQLVDTWSSRPTHESGQRQLLVGVGSGAERFLETLGENIRRLGVAIDLDRAELSTITRDAGPGRVRVSRPPAACLAGRLVTVVQEVLSTGLSATFLSGWLRRRGASSVEACVLVDREAARVVDVPIVCRGFTAPDVVLAGYGLSRRREYRDLPFIAEIETD
jgi:hypoxanthine phosphoribosyltransferase